MATALCADDGQSVHEFTGSSEGATYHRSKMMIMCYDGINFRDASYVRTEDWVSQPTALPHVQ